MSDQRSCAQHHFTPGPWQFYADVPSTDPNWHIVTNASRMRVIANVHIEPGNKMDAANARLIAAAPDLLDALREFVKAAKSWHEMHHPIGIAAVQCDWLCECIPAGEAALAKAEGSQPNHSHNLATESALEDGLEAEAEMRKARGEGLYE